MSTEATLEGIWEDFRDARSEKSLERMKLCLREFELECNATVLPNHSIQKHMARKRVIENSIARRKRAESAHLYGEGSW